MKRVYILLVLLGVAIFVAANRSSIRKVVAPATNRVMSHQTIAQRLKQHGVPAGARLSPHFAWRKVTYPPAEVIFVDLKEEKILHTVLLAPVDFRAGNTLPESAKLPEWTGPLYQEIKTRLAALPHEKTK